MHDADGIFSTLVTIVIDSLNQGTGAVSKSNNAYFSTPHLFTSAISVCLRSQKTTGHPQPSITNQLHPDKPLTIDKISITDSGPSRKNPTHLIAAAISFSTLWPQL
jgi:hypothetical protein